ncbi:MAG: hydroxyacylglutathione hydrolase [Bdellovibrionales bacterium]|nr:hydroxyacylglutathione hydrolase [Bdellovibrionales bacterium]
MLKVSAVPILKDNYVFIPTNGQTKECVIIDPGQADAVKSFILKEHLRPRGILLTHHHWDHIGGAQELKKAFDVKIYAPLKEQKLIDFADVYLQENDFVFEAGMQFRIIDLPGHTMGHIAYLEEKQKWLFSGDVLFSLGCGRIFDGTIEDHYKSLGKIKALDPSTIIHCTHEYTEMNLKFCLEKFPEDPALKNFAQHVQALRSQGKPTVPFPLNQELELNPFLKAKNEADFIALREERNNFKT